VLKINGEVAGYFKRRKLIANQVIEKELEDGGLLVSAKGRSSESNFTHYSLLATSYPSH
jgi:hypothetical protein